MLTTTHPERPGTRGHFSPVSVEDDPLGLIHSPSGLVDRVHIAASMQPSHAGYTRADLTDEWAIRLRADPAARVGVS